MRKFVDIANKELKRRLIDVSYRRKLSHIGSCLTALSIINEIFKIKKRDEKFILSAGHAHLAHAVVMEKYGIIKDAEKNIEEHGIHCERIGGCDFSTGSLGHGISASIGMALADRNKNVYCLISDGECAEGSVWEALRIKNELELNNLKIYLNYNGWGAYKAIDNRLMQRLVHFGFDMDNIYHTEFNMLLPILREPQEAHYVVLDKEKYDKIMEVLK